MSGKRKGGRQKKNGGRRFRRAIVLFSVLAVLLIAFFIFILVFRVNTTDVVGNSHYTDEEIREMVEGGPITQNSVIASVLYRDRKIDGADFIDHVSVVMTGRHSIRIEVTEKDLIGFTEADGAFWYFDQRGEIMASTAEREPFPAIEYEEADLIQPEIEEFAITPTEIGEDGTVVVQEPSEAAEEQAGEASEERVYLPYVTGLSVPDAAIGSYVTAADPEALNVIALIKGMTNRNHVVPDTVRYEADGTWTLCYGNVFVLLGNGNFLQIRITEMTAILPKLGGRNGYLHLENFDGTQNRIIFSRD